jgi:hypothetical protein
MVKLVVVLAMSIMLLVIVLVPQPESDVKRIEQALRSLPPEGGQVFLLPGNYTDDIHWSW